MLRGGHAENALPQTAQATVNCRLLPTEDPAAVPRTLERVDSPEQIDSWNRTWVFFEWILRPYEDRSKPAPPVRVNP